MQTLSPKNACTCATRATPLGGLNWGGSLPSEMIYLTTLLFSLRGDNMNVGNDVNIGDDTNKWRK